MKKQGTTILLLLVFLTGLGIMLYPTVSDAVNRAHQTRVLDSYDKTVSALENDLEKEQMLEAARAYNAAVAADSKALLHPEQFPEYATLLNVSGSGVMGYVSIPKLRTMLPIYHGTDASVLQVGAGHLEGTSLPIGGAGTHAVLSAHRGLPSARLFTDLDQLEIGDTFQITVLDRTLTYAVDKISIVLPTETELLAVEPEGDYVTLMTCTPYGINSHRLLVRGVRVPEDQRTIVVTSEAYRMEPILVAGVLAAPLLLVLLIWLFWPKKKGGNGANEKV